MEQKLSFKNALEGVGHPLQNNLGWLGVFLSPASSIPMSLSPMQPAVKVTDLAGHLFMTLKEQLTAGWGGVVGKDLGASLPPTPCRTPESPPRRGAMLSSDEDGDFLVVCDIKMHFYKVQ